MAKSDQMKKLCMVGCRGGNPDDISAHLYSAALLTPIEHDEVNNRMLSNHARIIRLLSAVEKAILIDANYFSAFLNVLDKTPRYRPIARRARGEWFSILNEYI